MGSKRDALLDNYYRTVLLMPNISEIDVDEYKYTVRNGHVVLNFIEDNEVVKQPYYKLADGFEVIIPDTFMNYEFSHTFDTLDLNDVKQIEYCAFAYLGVKNLIGNKLLALDDGGLTKIQHLNTIQFENLERFSIYSFQTMEDYQNVCYARLGKLELKTKEECYDFFTKIYSIARETLVKSMGDARLKPAKSYIDTTKDKISFDFVTRGRPYI